MAAGFDLLGRPITPPHHVGFAVADGARAGLTEFSERQKLLHPIGPGESQFVPTWNHGYKFERFIHQVLPNRLTALTPLPSREAVAPYGLQLRRSLPRSFPGAWFSLNPYDLRSVITAF
jgi:hypothetical protein